MDLNPRSPVPLYQQFKTLVERKIASGEWGPGEALPPELTLGETYGISRTTVRQALDELVKEGRISRARGRGTFVSPPKIAQTLADLTGFAEELTLRGLGPVIKVLGHELKPAPAGVAETLGLEPGTPVLEIRRLVEVGGLPLFVDESSFPADLAPVLAADRVAAQPIYRLLEAAGRSPSEGDQWLGAVAIPADVAEQLQVEPGAPGLSIVRVTRDGLGTPIEHTTVIYRGDRYHYAISLQRRRL
jgi:GntR family transcriptional regulator